jgi:hypothetical protein
MRRTEPTSKIRCSPADYVTSSDHTWRERFTTSLLIFFLVNINAVDVGSHPNPSR